MSTISLAAARRHPALTFGCAGGVFALLFLFAAPVGDFLAGRAFSPPSGLLWLFVVGGLLGGYVLARD